MTAATKTKTSPLARLEQLEAEQARAAAEHSELSREQHRVFTRARELSDQRRRETHRDPTLVDAHGSPVDPGGVIATIDKELESLGDLHDLAARVTHAREVERKRQGDVQAFIEEHAEELLEELVPVGEEHIAAVAERVAALVEEAERYLGFTQRITGLTHAAQRLDSRSTSRSTDSVANLLRTLEGWRGLLPNPAEDAR